MTLADERITRMTAPEFLELPDDGTKRFLIHGELREGGMTRRNRWHAGAEARIAYLLGCWLENAPTPKGHILSGEAGFWLRRDPDTVVAADVAYVSDDVFKSTPINARLIEGVPILAVEILSPSDRQEEIVDKVTEYLAHGVKLVWVVEPVLKTVTIYRPDAPPAMCSGEQALIGDPYLPGFHTKVAGLFQS